MFLKIRTWIAHFVKNILKGLIVALSSTKNSWGTPKLETLSQSFWHFSYFLVFDAEKKITFQIFVAVLRINLDPELVRNLRIVRSYSARIELQGSILKLKIWLRWTGPQTSPIIHIRLVWYPLYHWLLGPGVKCRKSGYQLIGSSNCYDLSRDTDDWGCGSERSSLNACQQCAKN